MVLEGCFTCVKYLMFAFNFLFWLLGCAMIGVGIWIKVHPETFSSATKDTQLEVIEKDLSSYGFSNVGAYCLIVVGSFVMIVSFLGCCGAVKESQCMLGMFFMALFVIFSALVGIGIYSIVMKEELKQEISKVLHKKLQDMKNDKSSPNVMKFIEQKFDCCGVDGGIEDFIEHSQCLLGHEKQGCVEKMYEKYSQNIVIIAGVAVGIAAVLFVGMTFSLLLCCAIREQSDGKMC